MKRTIDSRRALTLLEVLLVAAIIGVLAGLVLSAISPMRESARRVDCSNRLRQIGVAMHQNTDAHGVISQGRYSYEKSPRHFVMTNLNFLVEYLPFLGEVELHSRMMEHPDSAATMRTKPPSLYWCPSLGAGQHALDLPEAVALRHAYAGNRGLDPNHEESWEGGIFRNHPVRPGEITDGLAATAAVSEIVPSMETSRYAGWVLQVTGAPGSPTSLANCGDLSRPADHYQPSVGSHWLMEPFYDHTFPPLRNSCEITVPWPFFLVARNPGWATTPANSAHPGGVNVLMCDGSLRFVSGAIDLKVWHAAATRNGCETEAGL